MNPMLVLSHHVDVSGNISQFAACRNRADDLYDFINTMLEDWSGDDVDEFFELLESQFADVGVELVFEYDDDEDEDEDEDLDTYDDDSDEEFPLDDDDEYDEDNDEEEEP